MPRRLWSRFGFALLTSFATAFFRKSKATRQFFTWQWRRGISISCAFSWACRCLICRPSSTWRWVTRDNNWYCIEVVSRIRQWYIYHILEFTLGWESAIFLIFVTDNHCDTSPEVLLLISLLGICLVVCRCLWVVLINSVNTFEFPYSAEILILIYK